METKPIWKSKTLWANALGLIGIIVVGKYIDESMWMEISAATLTVINLLLRLITKEPLVWESSPKQ